MLIEFILYLLLKYVFDTSCLFQLFCDAWISITLLTSLSKKIIIPIKNLIRNENYLICAKPFFLSFEKKKKNTLLDIAHRMVSSSNWFNILPPFLSVLSFSLFSLSPPFSFFSPPSPPSFYTLFPQGFLCFHLTLVKESLFSNTFFYQRLFSIVSNSIFLNYLISFLYNYNILLSCLFFLSYLANAMSFSLSLISSSDVHILNFFLCFYFLINSAFLSFHVFVFLCFCFSACLSFCFPVILFLVFLRICSFEWMNSQAHW